MGPGIDEPTAWTARADPSGPTGMMAAELRCFCRVVRGIEPAPAGATYEDALPVASPADGRRAVDQLTVALESSTIQGFLSGNFEAAGEATEGLTLARQAGQASRASSCSFLTAASIRST